MSALLGQAARRIGGSVLWRTQAAVISPAVAEERRRLVPRRMTTDARAPEEITRDIKRKQQELADAIAEGRRSLKASSSWRDCNQRPSAQEAQQKIEKLYEALSKVENLRNRGLLLDLVVHVKPKPEDAQWRRLRGARRISNFIDATGTAVFVYSVVVVYCVYGSYDAAVKQAKKLKKKQVATCNGEGKSRGNSDGEASTTEINILL